MRIVGISGGAAVSAPAAETEALARAIQALAAGIASVDRSGSLLTADERFLGLHGIDAADGEARHRLVGRSWPHAMQSKTCRLPGEDAAALTAQWSTLIKSAAQAGSGRAGLRLTDGRTLELTSAASPDETILLVAKDSTEVATIGERRLVQRGFVHDVNNTLGGMLANLYLATADIEADHPARQWLEAVNLAAVELRSRVREVAGTMSGAIADKSRRR